MSENVVRLPTAVQRPTADQMVSRIRQMTEAGRMRFDHAHFQKRLLIRGLNMRQVIETVRKGCAVGTPTQDQWGDWRLKLKRKVAGRRVQVVVAMKADHFVVVTAI